MDFGLIRERQSASSICLFVCLGLDYSPSSSLKQQTTVNGRSRFFLFGFRHFALVILLLPDQRQFSFRIQTSLNFVEGSDRLLPSWFGCVARQVPSLWFSSDDLLTASVSRWFCSCGSTFVMQLRLWSRS